MFVIQIQFTCIFCNSVTVSCTILEANSQGYEVEQFNHFSSLFSIVEAVHTEYGTACLTKHLKLLEANSCFTDNNYLFLFD